MRNFKALVATSLACVLDVSVMYGESCNANSNYACFKYDDKKVDLQSEKKDWISYKKSQSNPSVFGSLSNFDGQFVPKDSTLFLGIANYQSTLLLSGIGKEFGLKFPFSVGLYVSGGNEDALLFSSTNGLTVGNLVVTHSLDNREGKKSTRVAHLVFRGNGMVSPYDVMDKSQDYMRSFSSVARSMEVPMAFLGGIWNNSGNEVKAEFKGGARMMGNVYTRDYGSKNSLFFEGKDSIAVLIKTFWGSRQSFSVVFHGGIFAENGGQNQLNIEEGGVVAESLLDGCYGIEAKNGGKNSLVFGGNIGGSKPQSLFAMGLTASSTSVNSDTENEILFKNSVNTGNLIVVGSAFASSGKNIIWTDKNTKANLEVEHKMVANFGGSNTVVLDGGTTIGKIALMDSNNQQDSRGLVAKNGGTNTIRLKDTSNGKDGALKQEKAPLNGENKDRFGKQRFLVTSSIYATNGGVNDVDIDGDLVLLFRGEFGGKIIATNGGKNQIEANGGFFAVGYESPNDIPLSRTSSVRKEYDINLGASNSSIVAYGGENSIKIKSVGKDDGILGKGDRNLKVGNISAYNGGSNNVSLHGSDKKEVNIREIIAESSGSNVVNISGGSSVLFQNIVTGPTGKNTLMIFAEGYTNNAHSQRVDVSNLSYFFGGETSLYFTGTQNGYVSENGLTLSFQGSKGEEKNVSFTFWGNYGKNSRTYDLYVKSGEFDGDVQYDFLNGGGSNHTKTQTSVNYFLSPNTIFLGNIGCYADSSKSNNTLSLQSSSKFILKNQGTTYFGTLILSNSTSPNSDVLKDTIKLPGTALDLATNGESYSNFNRGSQGKTLEVGTLAINAGDNSADSGNTHNPLLRLFVGGTAEGQADNLKVGKFVSKSPSNGKQSNGQSIKYKIPSETSTNGKNSLQDKEVTNFGKTLDTQIFLPTSLIGQDFTGKNVVILFVGEGGGELELNSRVAQTGFTNYWVEIQKQEIEKTAQGANGVSGGNGVNGQVTASTTAVQAQALSATASSSTASTTTSTTSPTSPSPSQDTPKSHQWVLGKTIEASISEDSIKLADTILTHNHSAWTLAINSLNKRMGELRDNPYSQGVWARIFGGEQTSNHGSSNINSGYVTLQGGYDYAFTLNTPWGQAKNYLGVALSYNLMSSKSEEFMGSGVINDLYAYNATSHGVEVGIYNTFIYDWGLYFDTIIKFGYITTGFEGINAHSSQANVSNYHTTLGAEVGYQFRLGKNQEWSVTPQVELIYGYLSQSDAKQYYDGQTLHSTLEGVSTLRARVGSDFAYRFKKWGNFYDLRLGISYEGDYANANASYGVVGAGYLDKISKDSLISTDHRIVLNVGTNMQVHDQVRLYVDLESSFCGKINTKYQLNLGARYSFGEKKLSTAPKERINLPVRVEGE